MDPGFRRECDFLSRYGLPELPRAGEALRHAAAGAAAGAAPGGEVELGAGAVFTLPPGEPVGQPEHLGVGKPARPKPRKKTPPPRRHPGVPGGPAANKARVAPDKGPKTPAGRPPTPPPA